MEGEKSTAEPDSQVDVGTTVTEPQPQQPQQVTAHDIPKGKLDNAAAAKAMKQQLVGCWTVLKTIFQDVTDCHEENDYEEPQLAAPHLDWRYSKDPLKLLETIDKNRLIPESHIFLAKEHSTAGHIQHDHTKRKHEEMFLRVVTDADLPGFITVQLAEQIRENDVKGALRTCILIGTIQPSNTAAKHMSSFLQSRLKHERNAIIMGLHGLHGPGDHGMHDEHGMHHSIGGNSSGSSNRSESSTGESSDNNSAFGVSLAADSSSDISY